MDNKVVLDYSNSNNSIAIDYGNVTISLEYTDNYYELNTDIAIII